MTVGRRGRNPAFLLAKMQFGSKLPGGHVGLYCCGRPQGYRRDGFGWLGRHDRSLGFDASHNAGSGSVLRFADIRPSELRFVNVRVAD